MYDTKSGSPVSQTGASTLHTLLLLHLMNGRKADGSLDQLFPLLLMAGNATGNSALLMYLLLRKQPPEKIPPGPSNSVAPEARSKATNTSVNYTPAKAVAE